MNACTIFLSQPDRATRTVDLAAAFDQAYPQLYAPSEAGYQLFAAGPGGTLSSVFVPADSERIVVLGRHTRCDLVLSDDPALSLRHLLARAVVLESGELALRLLDLATPLAFRTAESEELRSAFCVGPFAFSIGLYAFFAIPAGVDKHRELPAVRSASVAVVPRVRSSMGPPMPMASLHRSSWRSQITQLPPAGGLNESASAAAPGSRTLLLRWAGGSLLLRKSEEQLAQGVLIGRYARCEGASRLGASISRVHLLLLHEGGEDFAFDVASTFGTYRDDGPTRRVVLGREERLTLAPGCDSLTVDWIRGK